MDRGQITGTIPAGNWGIEWLIGRPGAETCLELAERGIGAVVFEHPWNQGQHHLPVVRSWQEIAALVAG